MKNLLIFSCAASLCYGETKDELVDRGWSCAKEALTDTIVGSVKWALGIHQGLKGDFAGSLYLHADAGVSLSDAIKEWKESYTSFKSALEWREERDNETN